MPVKTMLAGPCCTSRCTATTGGTSVRPATLRRPAARVVSRSMCRGRVQAPETASTSPCLERSCLGAPIDHTAGSAVSRCGPHYGRVLAMRGSAITAPSYLAWARKLGRNRFCLGSRRVVCGVRSYGGQSFKKLGTKSYSGMEHLG